jgi:hypothetical protein
VAQCRRADLRQGNEASNLLPAFHGAALIGAAAAAGIVAFLTLPATDPSATRR